VLAQFVEDLLHLEGRGDGLDEHGGPDGARRQAEQFLRVAEYVVPQPRFEMALQLGQVEVRPATALQLRTRAVEQVEPEVHQRGGDRPPVDHHVLLDQVPAAGAHDDRRRVGADPVALGRSDGEVEPAGDRVAQVQLAADHVGPGG
jgi:hypothetical protein